MGQQSKKGKSADTRPARTKRRNLGAQLVQVRKIRNLMLHCGLTLQEATTLWMSTRKRHVT